MFRIGDCVVQKSGGPTMKVFDDSPQGMLWCAWEGDDGRRKTSVFWPEELQPGIDWEAVAAGLAEREEGIDWQAIGDEIDRVRKSQEGMARAVDGLRGAARGSPLKPRHACGR
jgi:uncharacterized protein YodC (DUF2158 family)